MREGFDIAEGQGLQFFGKVSASISHELKNVLAIINENAGLLQDYTLRAEKGIPLETERIKILAERMKGQVRRGDQIIKNMNWFAHSVDEIVKAVDLCDVLEHVIALAERLAAMKGVTLKINPATNPVRITTSPFFLENLIWICLEYTWDSCGKDKTVSIDCETEGRCVRIRYSWKGNGRESPTKSFPTQNEKFLLEMLNAQISVAPEEGEIVLILPVDLTG